MLSGSRMDLFLLTDFLGYAIPMHLAMKFSLQTDQPVPKMAYEYTYTSAIVHNLLTQHFTFVLAYAFF